MSIGQVLAVLSFVTGCLFIFVGFSLLRRVHREPIINATAITFMVIGLGLFIIGNIRVFFELVNTTELGTMATVPMIITGSGALLMVLAIFAIVYSLTWQKFKFADLEARELEIRWESQIRERGRKTTAKSKRLAEIVEEKKRKFLDVPNISFHFANKEQIKSFYNDYFKEPAIKSFVSEITEEVSSGVKGRLPQVLESRIGSRDLGKWISTFKLPGTSEAGMFLQYQRETIKNEQVSLGIEEVEIELNELQEFDDAVNDLEKRFGLHLDEKVLDKQRTSLKQKAAEKTLVKLEKATGWVLMEGRFQIIGDGEFYKCLYYHPVNRYLSDDVGPITISVLVQPDFLEPQVAGNYAQSIGKAIPLKVYGNVWQPIDRKRQVWDLQLTALAIY